MARNVPDDDDGGDLSAKQIQLAWLLASGRSRREAAKEIGIAPRTVSAAQSAVANTNVTAAPIRRAMDIFMEHILTGGWNSESKSSHLNGCRTTNATGPVAHRTLSGITLRKSRRFSIASKPRRGRVGGPSEVLGNRAALG